MNLFCVRIVVDLGSQELRYYVDVLCQAMLLFVCACCSVYSAYAVVYLVCFVVITVRENFV